MLRYNSQTLRRFARLDPKVLAYNVFYELHSGVITPTSKKSGLMLPNSIYVETNSSCKKSCRDCYVPLEDRKQHISLSGKNLKGITDVARAIRMNYLTILGGAPFAESTAKINLEWMGSNPGMRFAVCTGGEGLEKPDVMGKLKSLYNATIVFSLDGFAKANDRIRGNGSFAETIAALREYSQGGRRLSGVIATLRKDNIEEVASQDFLQAMCSNGCYYFTFGPYYTQNSDYSITPKEYADAILRLMEAARSLPAVIFSNHFGQLFGKEAKIANRIQAINIDYRGNVYTARRGKIFGNINEQPLLEILNSRAFQGLFASKHREYDFEAVSETDLRYPLLLKETVRILESSGVSILR